MVYIFLDMPRKQETCTSDHQYHLSAEDDGQYKGRDGAVFFKMYFLLFSFLWWHIEQKHSCNISVCLSVSFEL